jgi:pimeloyl-ACP methyl ester carboxylesterase
LVLLHGLFGGGDNWSGIAPKLAERFRVLMPDLRNHGLSPHSDMIDYPQMAADVAELLASAGAGRASIVGHSMGGKTAMQLALDSPQVVSKLVVVDIAPRAYLPGHDNILDALLALNLPDFASRQQIEDALATEIPSLPLRRFLLKSVARDSNGKFFWKMNLRGLAKNYDKLCCAVGEGRTFAGPTLFIRGGSSDYIRAADEAEIYRQFPAARIETITSAGHWVHADAPEEFARLVLEFL